MKTPLRAPRRGEKIEWGDRGHPDDCHGTSFLSSTVSTDSGRISPRSSTDTSSGFSTASVESLAQRSNAFALSAFMTLVAVGMMEILA